MLRFSMGDKMEERKLENTLYSSIARLYHKNRCFMDEQLRKRGITELGFSHIRIIIISDRVKLHTVYHHIFQE